MLREIIELGVHNFQDFEREFPGIHEHLDQCCDQLTKVGFYLNDHLITHTDFPAFGSMLLTVHRTLVGAAVRFVTKDYDEGMMLLRSSCEQARDLCALMRNPLLFFLWLGYRTKRSSLAPEDLSKFHKEFRFDVSTSLGERVKWVYDRTSEVGVHGASILTQHYRRLPSTESYRLLQVLLVGLASLPSLCHDSFQPFVRAHTELIDRKLGMSVDDFLLEVGTSYALAGGHLLIASQEVSKILEAKKPP